MAVRTIVVRVQKKCKESFGLLRDEVINRRLVEAWMVMAIPMKS
jgi:hypothetical protein